MPNDGRCLDALGNRFVAVGGGFVCGDIGHMDKKSFAIGALSAALLFVTFGAGLQQDNVPSVTEVHYEAQGHPWVYKKVRDGRYTDHKMYCLGVLLNQETGEIRTIMQEGSLLENGASLSHK